MSDDTESISGIRSIAVHAADIVEAYEGNIRSERSFVLRLTPPYHGRMRARIHDSEVDDRGVAIAFEPATLLDESEIPPYPDPADTEDALRADPTRSYTAERHRELHVERVREWRIDVSDAILESISVPPRALARGIIDRAAVAGDTNADRVVQSIDIVRLDRESWP